MQASLLQCVVFNYYIRKGNEFRRLSLNSIQTNSNGLRVGLRVGRTIRGFSTARLQISSTKMFRALQKMCSEKNPLQSEALQPPEIQIWFKQQKLILHINMHCKTGWQVTRRTCGEHALFWLTRKVIAWQVKGLLPIVLKPLKLTVHTNKHYKKYRSVIKKCAEKKASGLNTKNI